MIKKFTFCIMFGLILSASSAWAAGIGVYGTGGAAFSTWYYSNTSGASTTDYFYGGGLVIDSNAAKNTLFGYRFTLGYEQYLVKFPDIDFTTDPIHRFSMSHTFGFGIARSDSVRFWIGPRIGFHYLYKSKSSTTYEIYPGFGTITIMPRKIKVDFDYFGLDLLLALGVNFNIDKYVTLFFDIGFGYMGNYNINITEEAGHAFGLDGKAGIMFRVNDTYASAN